RDVYESGSVNTSAFAPLASVVFGPGGTPPVATRTEDGAYALLSYRWNALTIPAGGSVVLMQVLSGQADRDRAQAAAERLAALPPELLAGMSEAEGSAVLNFHVPDHLSSAVPPLPGNDGELTGHVLAGDRATVVPNGTVRFRSRSAYYGAPVLTSF